MTLCDLDGQNMLARTPKQHLDFVSFNNRLVLVLVTV